LNFSNNADESNDENTLIITNSDMAALYLAEFERRWAEAEAPDAADMGCKS
jgi:phosphatidylserine/phosphatidylglycerophosphate/cardiolipin synthase-like enzyme